MFTPREHFSNTIARPKRLLDGQISTPTTFNQPNTQTSANDPIATQPDGKITQRSSSQNDIASIFRRLSQQAA